MTDLPGHCQNCDAPVVLVGNRWCDASTRRPHKCKASLARLAGFATLVATVWTLLALHW